MEEEKQFWYVYMILCTDKSIYTGISKDIEKRFEQHLQKKGAKYFYSKTPQKIIHQEAYPSRGEAQSREMAIKKLSPKEKRMLAKV